MPVPTIGRIVHYRTETMLDGVAIVPGIVTRVTPVIGTEAQQVDLTVFPPGFPPGAVRSVNEDVSGRTDESGELGLWFWPPAVSV